MELARQAQFYDYLLALEKPPGTTLTLSHGSSPAENRNIMVDLALKQDATHVFFVDDDMLLPGKALTKLLEDDKDIVSGLYLHRNFPHAPIAMNVSLNDGRCRWKFLENGKTGLVEVVNFGLGCCLIKTGVFRTMERPWIRLGQLDPDKWNDDIEFFNRAREAGFELWLDQEVKCGHIANIAIWPEMREDGQWLTVYDSNGAGHAAFLAATPVQVYGEDVYERYVQENKGLVLADLS